MSWTLCTSGSAIVKAGEDANSTIIASGSALSEWSDEAEGQIVAKTRRDWVGSYSNVNIYIQQALADACSDLIAIKIINYDLFSYNSRLEAIHMINVLYDNANKIMNELKDFKTTSIKPPT